MRAWPSRRVQPFAGAAEHLAFELSRLELLLERQVLRLRAAHLLSDDPFRGLYIPDGQVDALLAGGAADQTGSPHSRQGLGLQGDREQAEFTELRQIHGIVVVGEYRKSGRGLRAQRRAEPACLHPVGPVRADMPGNV